MANPDNNSVAGVSYGGLRAWIKGKEFSLVIIVLLAFGWLGYMLWQHDNNTREGRAGAVSVLETQNKALSINQLRLQESMEEMIYVMSLSDEERGRLKIQMPESLRRKQGR